MASGALRCDASASADRASPYQDGGGDDSGPETLLVSDGRLRHVLGADDLVRQAINLFLLVPALVGIELEAQRRGQHLGGQLLGVIARNIFALTETVVFRQVAVQIS